MTAPPLCLWCRSRKDPPVPAVAAFTGACVHEHTREAPVCAYHLSQAQGLSARALYCAICCSAGEHSHFCLITITSVRELEPSGACGEYTGSGR